MRGRLKFIEAGLSSLSSFINLNYLVEMAVKIWT